MPSLEEVETEGDGNYDARRMASLLGIHLVSQVLDEACSIVNNEQKRVWFNDYRSGRLTLSGNTNIFQFLQGYSENKENISHVTTSTPQKDNIIKLKPENNFIGQGDEEIDIVSREDESQTEEEIEQEEEEIILDTEVQMFSSVMIASLVNTLFEGAFATSEQHDDKDEVQEIAENTEKYVLLRNPLDTSEISITEIDNDEKPKNPEDYCSSFADNVYEDISGNNVAFYVEEDNTTPVHDPDKIESEIVVVQAEIHDIDENFDASAETISIDEEAEKEARLESARYEDAYLTLNRDYEQCSDDEGDPILQDSKTPMQEVELIAASTEEEDDTNSSYRDAEEARKQLAATSAISGASSSRIKSRVSLVSRCRTQGARLLSCLRGWWRRKTPGKRKEARKPGSVRGLCPLSPQARRRASSLLDQRKSYSPLQSRSVVWKFNTVNEALVNSSKWKDYSFDSNADGCGEQC